MNECLKAMALQISSATAFQSSLRAARARCPPNELPRRRLHIFIVSLLVLFSLLSLLVKSNFSGNVTVHVIPHSHLDPGWLATTSQTYQDVSVPVYKQVILELLLDPRRTYTISPLLFFAKFLGEYKDEPVSTSVTAFKSPMEMYTLAVVNALARRADVLDSLSSKIIPSSFTTENQQDLNAWRRVPMTYISHIAAVLHDHENDADPAERVAALTALLTQTADLKAVADLFAFGAVSNENDADSLSKNAIGNFLNYYDARLREFMHQKDHGNGRNWEEKSLTALLSITNRICETVECVSDCSGILKDVGASLEGDSGGIAATLNLENCVLPSYIQVVKHLLSTNQLEVVSTGLVSHDESLSPYSAILDQMTLGRSFAKLLLQEKSVKKIGWQIDSFGHSYTTNKLYNGLNFDAVVYNRVRYDLKRKFRDKKGLVFKWTSQGAVNYGTPAFGRTSDSKGMLSILLRDHYNSIPEVKALETSNQLTPAIIVAARNTLLRYIHASKLSYPTRHVLLPVGDDNAFRKSAQYYEGLDAVIDGIRSQNPGVDIKYSTVQNYVKAVKSEMNGALSFSGSLQNYHTSLSDAWTGYYSSRGHLKHRIAVLIGFLNVVELQHALAIAWGDSTAIDVGLHRDNTEELEHRVAFVMARYRSMTNARNSVAAMLHHDAITGTCTDAVERDYLNVMSEGEASLQSVAVKNLESLNYLSKDSEDTVHIATTASLQSGTHANLGIGALLARDGFVELTLFNGVEYNTNRIVSVVVPCGASYTAFYSDKFTNPRDTSETGEGDGKIFIVSQLLPIFSVTGKTMKLSGEAGKAGFCKLLLDVEFYAFKSRKVVVQLFKTPETPPSKATDELKVHGLDTSFASAVLTSEKIDKNKDEQKFIFTPRILEGVEDNEVSFLVTYSKKKIFDDTAFTFSVDVTANDLPRYRLSLRAYNSYPLLNSLSRTSSSGAYVMKWNGFSLVYLAVDWLVYYFGGVLLCWLAALGLRNVKKRNRRKKAAFASSEVAVAKMDMKVDAKAETKPKVDSRRLVWTKYTVTLILAILLGRLMSAVFSAGTLDSFLNATPQHVSTNSNHADAPFLFAGAEKVDESKTYNSIPGVIVIREMGLTLGVVSYFLGGFQCAAIFGPTVVLSAVRHTLANPLLQSRPLGLTINDDVDDDSQEQQLLAVMSDGPLASSVTFLAVDGGIVTMTHYRAGLDVKPVDLSKHGRMFLQTEIDVLPKMDTDVVAIYESLEVGGDGGASLVVDDGLTLSSTSYSSMTPVSSNYQPVVSGGSVSWRGGGNNVDKGIGSLMVLPSQSVGVCGTSPGSIEVMVGRRHSGDDEKGLSSSLDDGRRVKLAVGTLVSSEAAGSSSLGSVSYQDVIDGRRISSYLHQKPVLAVASSLRADAVLAVLEKGRKAATFVEGSGGVGSGSLVGDELVELVQMQFWTREELEGGDSQVKGIAADRSVYVRLRNLAIGEGLPDKVVDLEWLLRPTRVCEAVSTWLDFEDVTETKSGAEEVLSKKTIVSVKTGQVRAFRLILC